MDRHYKSWTMSHKLSGLFLVIAITLFTFGRATAQDHGHGGDHAEEVHTEEADHGHGDSHDDDRFNPGEMIFEHILDAHEIHFFTLGSGHDAHHVSVPLPVILWTENGIVTFMSGAFEGHGHHREAKVGGVTYHMEKQKIYYESEGQKVYPLDFSITKTVVGMFLVTIIMFLIFPRVAKAYATRKGQAPKGLQNVIEPLVIFVRDEIAVPAIGQKHFEKFLPYLLSIFFFIWISNVLGLIPFIGGFNIMGQISVTLALAIFTFFITNLNANKHYWSHIFAMPGVPPLVLIILTPIEILSIFIKPTVLMIRLFANITAGHMIILALVSLIFIFNSMMGPAAGAGISVVSLAFAMFINVIEILVAFLQAFVFTLLSALYFGAATEEAHDHH